MKKLVSLLGALALIACGEKNESGAGVVEVADSSADSQAAGNQTEESSADTAKPPPAELPVIESPIDTPPLDIKTIAALAAKHQEKVEFRENTIRTEDGPRVEGYLYYIKGTDKLYSGVHYGVVSGPEGDPVLYTVQTIKDGKPDGLQTGWHENGQKAGEGTYKDGEKVSMKYWNSKGEEVETAEEAEE